MVFSVSGPTEILVAVVPVTGKQLAHKHHLVELTPDTLFAPLGLGSFGVKVMVLPVFVQILSYA
jgi:hypothetical protein